MASYSREDLAIRVLRDLGLVGADETPTSADLDWTVETITSEVALLSSKGIPIWNGSDYSIPVEYMTALSRRIGLAVAPSFGLTDIASATAAMRVVEQDLRIIGAVPATGSVAEAEYF